MGLASAGIHSILPSLISPSILKPLLKYQFPSTPASSLLFSSVSSLHSGSSHLSNNHGKTVLEATGRRISCDVMKEDYSVEEEEEETCELVNGFELALGEGTDRFNAYLFKAVKNNNGIGILLLSDIFGFDDSSTRDFAYRVACNGYNVLVPDLFHGDPWGKDRPRSMFEEWISRHSPENVAKLIAISTQWMVDEFIAAGISKKLGVIGFCYGGGRVMEALAQDGGASFGSGISFYGTRMNLQLASQINVPVLFITGDNDPLCAVNDLNQFVEKIDKGSKLVVFPGRGHGFVHRPESTEEDSDAEQAFTIMRNWFHDSFLLAQK